MQLTLPVGCTKLMTTTFISFSKQPNGQNDLLILGITNHGASANIEIGVSQKKVMGLYLYQYIIISLAALIGLAIIIAGMIFVAGRRARNIAARATIFAQIVSPFHNIQHF